MELYIYFIPKSSENLIKVASLVFYNYSGSKSFFLIAQLVHCHTNVNDKLINKLLYLFITFSKLNDTIPKLNVY